MTEHNRVRAIAFYLPQYHPIPENDRWWGEGFTEWTNVKRALPLFPGHYQPHEPGELGYYDLRSATTRQQQADLAKEYGLSGFCYYHYWFRGQRLLERVFNEVLKTGQPDFPFCLCWANQNWTRGWDGQVNELLMAQSYCDEDSRAHMRWLVKAFRDPRYIRIDGRPVFLVYQASDLPDALGTTAIWREEARNAGVGDIYLCRVESFQDQRPDPSTTGFDAAVEFQPDSAKLLTRREKLSWRLRKIIRMGHGALICDYASWMRRALEQPKAPYTLYPCVTPAWDNSARKQWGAFLLKDSTPTLYGRWLEAVLTRFVPPSPEENLVFINAWNEWGEGAHLEPCHRWGRAYLDATKRAIERVQG